jgi:hypothetical protein
MNDHHFMGLTIQLEAIGSPSPVLSHSGRYRAHLHGLEWEPAPSVVIIPDERALGTFDAMRLQRCKAAAPTKQARTGSL